MLQKFDFNDVFYGWISNILHSAKLSISVNGKAVGYFNCSRGVRQEDPLLPVLFCIAEEVLSRGIAKLVRDDMLRLMPGPRGFSMPSHVLYVDDIMIFCRANKNSLENLLNHFSQCAQVSGQVVSADKSKFYVQGLSATRGTQLTNFLSFSKGSLPFSYLGVPLFIGRPKRQHLMPIIDRIKIKLASWKGSLLSIMGRVQLVNSIIMGMLVYSFRIYKWPASTCH